MKQILSFFLCLCFSLALSQEKQSSTSIDVNYFKGNIALHNDDILHLIKGHPEGLILKSD